MTKTELERIAVMETKLGYLGEDVEDIKTMVSSLYEESQQGKGARKTRGAIFWGGIGFVAYIGANFNAILSFFKGA
jgi:hypothetical protein